MTVIFFLKLASLSIFQKATEQGFPGGSVVKNLLASAGDMGSIPDLGGSLCRATSLCAITVEPVLQSPCATTTQAHSLYSPCFTTREATQ